MKGYSYTSTPPIGRTACTEPQCLYKGALYLYLTVELYVYSPCGPYGLYRACTSVQLFTFFQTPRAHNMPLDQKPHTRNFPLWNRRHQQSSSRTPTAERYPESVQSISRLHYPPFYAYFPSRLFLLRSFSHTLLQLHVHCILPAPRPLHPSIYLHLNHTVTITNHLSFMSLTECSEVLPYFTQLAKGLFSRLIYMGGLRKVQDLPRLSIHQSHLVCVFVSLLYS